MGSLNHGNVVGSITNGQQDAFEMTLDKFYDERFLKGGHTTRKKLAGLDRV